MRTGRPRTDDYLPDDDLAWFCLENYAGLEIADAAKWAQLIYDRLELLRYSGRPENAAMVLELFERLTKAPLDPLGFRFKKGAVHVSDTRSVKLMTVNAARTLLDDIRRQGEAEAAPEKEKDVFSWEHGNVGLDDVLLNFDDSIFEPFAHVAVDLRAPDVQIAADFGQWLKAWREAKALSARSYVGKLGTWTADRVLEYFDLHLCAELQNKKISGEVYAGLLGFGDSFSVEDQLRKVANKAMNTVFTKETFHSLLNAGGPA